MRSIIRMSDINGNEIDLNKYGLVGLKLDIPSPSYEYEKESIPGRAGEIPLGRTLQPRELTARFSVEANDYDDSLLLRDELYSLFSKDLYIGETKQLGKWWKVRPSNDWTPERLNFHKSKFDVPLISSTGMAESVANTLTIEKWTDEKLKFGMGLRTGNDTYVKTTNAFTIYNAGIAIDPRFMSLKITIKATGDNINIKNKTTTETVVYSGSLVSGDILTIDGIRITKNQQSVYRNTNHGLISLVHGVNEFEITNATVQEVSFDFKFYYL